MFAMKPYRGALPITQTEASIGDTAVPRSTASFPAHPHDRTRAMSARITRAVEAAKAAGIAFRLLEYDYDPSAEAIGLQAAAALGRDPGQVFKTLVAALDTGELVCALVPSDARLDVKALAAAAGAKRAELADPAKAERSSGYVVGGISPLGQRKRLRTFIDGSAEVLEEMVVNGGRRGLQLALSPRDLATAMDAAFHPLSAK
jgi:Cys-tRNA(Pro)/Cys-tRNA(Cys) deacylase